MATRVLIVEDEATTAMDLEMLLRRLGYTVLGPCAEGEEAVQLAAAEQADLALMDIRLSGALDGIETACLLRQRFDLPAVFLTGQDTDALIERAEAAQPLGYLLKPYSERELRATLKMAASRALADRQLAAAQALLRESEARFRELWESSRDAQVVCVAPDWKMTGGNAAAVALFGARDSAHLASCNPADLAPERQPDGELSSAKLRNVGKQIADHGHAFVEWVLWRFDGTEFVCEVSLTRLTVDGKHAVQAIMRDITARKAADAALRRFRTTLDATTDGVFMFDPASLRFFYVNQAGCAQVGYSEAELLAMHSYDLRPDYPEPKFRQLVARLLAGEQASLRVETRHRHRDGHDIPVEMFLQLIAPPGEPPRFLSIVTDIRERLAQREAVDNAERQARHAHENLRRLLENFEDAVVVLDDENTIRFANHAAGQLFGARLAIGDYFGVPLADARSECELVQPGGKVKYAELRLGNTVWHGMKAQLVMLQDITGRREMADRLRKLQQAVESTSASVMITDPQGDITYANPGFTALTGYTAEEALGKNPRMLSAGLVDKQVYATMWQEVLGGATWRGEFCNRRKDGALIWEDASVSAVRDDEGTVVGFVAIQLDITALKQTQAQQQAMLDNPLMGIVRVKERRIVWANQAFETMLGYDRGEMTGMPMRDNYLDDASYEAFDAACHPIISGGGVFRAEQEHRRKDGSVVHLDMSGTLLAGSPGESLWAMLDITESKRLLARVQELGEAQLAQSEARYRLLADNTQDFVSLYDRRGKLLYESPSVARLWGNRLDRRDSQLTHPEDRPWVEAGFRALLRDGGNTRDEYRLLLPSGKVIWVESLATAVRGEDGRVSGVLRTMRDITPRRLAEARLRRMVALSSAWYWETDAENRFVVMGDTSMETAKVALPLPSFRNMVLGRRRWEIEGIAPQSGSWEEHRAQLAARQPVENFEYTVTIEGETRWVAISGEPFDDADGNFMGYRGVGRELTAQKRAAEQVAGLQKSELIGQLTGGLAHDFRNMLGVAVGNLDLLEEMLAGTGGRELARLEAARKAVLKGIGVTESLLAVAGRRPLTLQLADLNELLREMAGLAKTAVGSAVAMELELFPDALPARVDASGFGNAVLNLVVNARDAMKGQSGEQRVALRSRRVRVEAHSEEAAKGLIAQDYAVIEVVDSGPGMSEEVLRRAFDPYFTTKPEGEGTGLGLAMVHGFAEQLGGRALISSVLGEGTAIGIWIPLAADGAAPDAAPPATSP